MRHRIKIYKKFRIYKTVIICVLTSFSLLSILPSEALAQGLGALGIPASGSVVALSPSFTPALVRGIKVYPNNPFQFDFIVDSGDSGLTDTLLKQESEKLIRYFLASLTVPEDDLWVNLSPYEQDRIIPEELGKTEMGIDMLAQDYLLKQITASLMNPEDDIGRQFWQKVYKQAYEQYGTTDIPVDTFNKVWIMPDKAEVYVQEDRAFILEAKLKVMLEEDYVALQRSAESLKDATQSLALDARDVALQENQKEVPILTARPQSKRDDVQKPKLQDPDTFQVRDDVQKPKLQDPDTFQVRDEFAHSDLMSAEGLHKSGAHLKTKELRANSQELAANLIRNIIIPALEQEVNHGQNFAQLRQIYHSLILAHWYKTALKDSILNKVYSDQNKISGIDLSDKAKTDAIYQSYLETFKQGVVNMIKVEYDPYTQQHIPRKYFAGGVQAFDLAKAVNYVSDLSGPSSVDWASTATLQNIEVNFVSADYAMTATTGFDDLSNFSSDFAMKSDQVGLAVGESAKVFSSAMDSKRVLVENVIQPFPKEEIFFKFLNVINRQNLKADDLWGSFYYFETVDSLSIPEMQGKAFQKYLGYFDMESLDKEEILINIKTILPYKELIMQYCFFQDILRERFSEFSGEPELGDYLGYLKKEIEDKDLRAQGEEILKRLASAYDLGDRDIKRILNKTIFLWTNVEQKPEKKVEEERFLIATEDGEVSILSDGSFLGKEESGANLKPSDDQEIRRFQKYYFEQISKQGIDGSLLDELAVSVKKIIYDTLDTPIARMRCFPSSLLGQRILVILNNNQSYNYPVSVSLAAELGHAIHFDFSYKSYAYSTSSEVTEVFDALAQLLIAGYEFPWQKGAALYKLSEDELSDPHIVEQRIYAVTKDWEQTLQSMEDRAIVGHEIASYILNRMINLAGSVQKVAVVINMMFKKTNPKLWNANRKLFIKTFETVMNEYSDEIDQIMSIKYPLALLPSETIDQQGDYAQAPGGIDFTADTIPLVTQGEGIDFAMPTNMSIESLMDALGLVPVIINIVPITNFNALLGLEDNVGKDFLVDDITLRILEDEIEH